MQNVREIYLAGGCFWGLEAYMQRTEGVLDAVCGYANGKFEHPTYQEVCTGETGFAETVRVQYDPQRTELYTLLRHFMRVIDPTSLNRQGMDIGSQYRTGIYYTDTADRAVADRIIEEAKAKYEKEILVEVTPLQNFYEAEEYHQNYLEKNPQGYCHIDLSLAEKPLEG
ncbi:MAG: peptide-methionine (S)-S-oxide reductase MsrA [Peptostreptococcaceae bacterium]|nr:peptide-methionine (S)-S-oxide reductase MsrA [Peptostreptococcaceae bacterium]